MQHPELTYISCLNLAANSPNSDTQGHQTPQTQQTPDSHRMAVWRWGRSDHPHAVICVHGISRQGRDFDVLAQALVAQDACQVLAVDLVGRGCSDWLADPMMYQVPQYASDMLTLLAQLKAHGVQTLDWVGTSLGGLVGMAVAAQTSLNPALNALALRRLVLNDVGPSLQWSALQRISGYLGADRRFSSEHEAIAYLWQLSVSFGPHTPQQWRALSMPMLVRDMDSGQYKLHYDPRIVLAVRAATQESTLQAVQMLWQLYDAISAQTLLLRGQDSDLLSVQTAQQMQSRGPKAKLVEFAGVGHAPTLVSADQVAVVQEFLRG